MTNFEFNSGKWWNNGEASKGDKALFAKHARDYGNGRLELRFGSPEFEDGLIEAHDGCTIVVEGAEL